MANKWQSRINVVQRSVYGKYGITVDMKDLKEAKKTFDAMGDLPAKIVTAAARKGASVVIKEVKGSGDIPVRTGALRNAVRRLRMERSRLKGKKIYPVGFDPAMNDWFQRKDQPIKNPGEAGGKSDHPYYPASMEYGFLTRSKGGGISYFPGFHFMAKAGENVRGEANAAMAKKFNEAIQKEWVKRHGS